jgi:hypothetical protein
MHRFDTHLGRVLATFGSAALTTPCSVNKDCKRRCQTEGLDINAEKGKQFVLKIYYKLEAEFN